jgi:hypothetical protein
MGVSLYTPVKKQWAKTYYRRSAGVIRIQGGIYRLATMPESGAGRR